MKQLLILSAALALAGCGGQNDELKSWMADAHKDVHPTVQKLSEPRTFTPYLYADQGSIDPFDPAKVANALRKLAAASSNGLAPDLNRRKEALEAFPLDSITMVGILQKPNLKYALLASDGVVYPIKLGNYVGQNFGIVTNITDSQVTLKEVVQDAGGEWVERISTLQLQERSK